LLLAGCLNPGDERAARDADVGQAEDSGLRVAIVGNQGQVRSFADGRLSAWSQSPILEIELEAVDAPTNPYAFRVENCLPETEVRLHRNAQQLSLQRTDSGGTTCEFSLDDVLAEDAFRLRLVPPDAEEAAPFVFAVLGDIQTALPTAHEIFAEINRDPSIRFVMSTGDLVQNAEVAEYDLLLVQLAGLDVPLYSTIGNHELQEEDTRWTERFGPMSVHFAFRGVYFSFVDSGNASIAPTNYDRLAGWLDAAAENVHIFGTHYPPRDPVGTRNAGFRSRAEAAKLVSRLIQGRVDATFYGHIHSYYAYHNGGIPAYISGGGGAIPERGNGVGRHFLRVAVHPSEGVQSVRLVPIP